jgi:hypothetical protein
VDRFWYFILGPAPVFDREDEHSAEDEHGHYDADRQQPVIEMIDFSGVGAGLRWKER